MTIFQTDPVTDPRWQDLLSWHPHASVFHSPAWLKSLRDTYGYRPVVFTPSEPGRPLQSGMAFCHVRSWITGPRLVSLPFSDHCQPLVENEDELTRICNSLLGRWSKTRFRYVELRPLYPFRPPSDHDSSLRASASFSFHSLDLQPDEGELYRRFHKSCIQRKLERAKREDLVIEHGRNEELLRTFYALLLLTRRRHQLPPQPLLWFSNLIENFGEDLVIWVARKGDRPVAAILTLASRNAVVYKYGCSDAEFNNLGGTPALFWEAIRYARSRKAKLFDMGRSDADNPGLIAFKGHWGTECHELTYYRYSPKGHVSPAESTGPPSPLRQVSCKIAKQLFSRLPDFCLTATGRLLYRHMA